MPLLGPVAGLLPPKPADHGQGRHRLAGLYSAPEDPVHPPLDDQLPGTIISIIVGLAHLRFRRIFVRGLETRGRWLRSRGLLDDRGGRRIPRGLWIDGGRVGGRGSVNHRLWVVGNRARPRPPRGPRTARLGLDGRERREQDGQDQERFSHRSLHNTRHRRSSRPREFSPGRPRGPQVDFVNPARFDTEFVLPGRRPPRRVLPERPDEVILAPG